ncbi:oxysterol-binding protein 1 [Microdochium nivale]|nr:oxysterol-binding protein 1 [Microdochium nivale]
MHRNSHGHSRTKSAARSLLRRKDKDRDSRNDDDARSAVSDDNDSAMSLNRDPSREANLPSAPARAVSNAGLEKASTLESSVRKFRIVEALRSGNTSAISKAIRETAEGAPRPSTSSISGSSSGPLDDTTVLHLAIQCAEFEVVQYILSDGAGTININSRDKDGNVPLHIAATHGRANVVLLLLQQKNINDAVANNQGKLPLDVARSPEIFQHLQLARTLFLQEKVQEVQQYIQKGNYDSLTQLLEEPRVKTILDINSTELPSESQTVDSGGSLLHEAARKRDNKLIQALLLHGADPFQRDRNGKLPQHVTNDESTKAMLKRSPAAVAAQRSIQEKAVLGHATSQAGPIAAGAADPTAGREPTMKGYLKKWTNYRKGYQLRWFVLENGVLSYYKHQDDAENACRGAISMRIATLNMSPDDKTKFEIIGKSSVKYTLRANHEAEAKRWFWALNNAIQWMKDQAKAEERNKAQGAEYLKQAQDQFSKAGSSVGELQSEAASLTEPRASVQLSRNQSGKGNARLALSRGSVGGSIDDDFVDAGTDAGHESPATTPGDHDADDDDYAGKSSIVELPSSSKDAFNITAQSARLQLDTLAQVSAALQAEANRNPSMSLADPKATQALATYDSAIRSLKGLMGDLLRISKDRDAHWQYRLDQEVDMRQMWEESMAKVAAEQEDLETRVGKAELKHKITKRALRDLMEGSGEIRQGNAATTQSSQATTEDAVDGPKSPAALSRKPTTLAGVDSLTDDSESEVEEFFDAVDAGEVNAEPMPPSELTAAGNSAQQEVVISRTDISSSYKGYETFRSRLKLDSDNRPKVGLWGILKSMIGKDMTKMTLPVAFNEPTSLLYRTGEDMEYAHLLDQAADRTDSLERMLYVAAFASSEFASAVGRVAKPFNPLLGETFEYARPDKGYRFFIEQVSHHPPIGACFAEAAKWQYWGDANVDTRFSGKSFDIHHLGTWYLKLNPSAGGMGELYTWKKPSQQVIGIITGNPALDNYGLVEITNWSTGEKALIEFKARGWKASSAFGLAGKVVDKEGRTRWSVGGRWNSKIYARYTPGFEAQLDESGEGPGSINDPSKAFVIWEANDRPKGIPFNLTPFVLTFNDINDNLRKYIAPTDSRYRTDQRAMEDGEYDFAADEKNRLEQAQRARRKVREEKGEHFEPAWFTKAKCETTGKPYWKYNGKYWEQREKFGNGDTSAWDGLEPVFSDA